MLQILILLFGSAVAFSLHAPDCISGSPGCANNEEGIQNMQHFYVITKLNYIDLRVLCDGYWWISVYWWQLLLS